MREFRTLRIERRLALGYHTEEYRVAESRRATGEDLFAGRAEGDQETGNYVAWVGVTPWGTLGEALKALAINEEVV